MRTGAAPLIGDQRPRLHVAPPAVTSAGAETVRLAASAGLILDDWQQWELDQALGEKESGKWAAFEVALIVARQNGKGGILEARTLAGLFLFGEELIIWTAHEFKTANEAFRRVRRLLENTDDMDRRIRNITESHGEEGIELMNGQRLRFIARSGGSGRGFTCDLLIYDEAMILDRGSVGASLPTLSARDNATEGGPQVWYTASAGLGAKSTQLARVRARALAADPDPQLCFSEYSIAAHDEYCDSACQIHDDPAAPRSWAKANPSLGIARPNGTGLTLAAVERMFRAMDPDTFARECLSVGTYPAPADGWAVIPRKWWDATMLETTRRPAAMTFAIDATNDRASTAIALAGDIDPQHTYVELADHRPGTSWVVGRAVELDKRWGPAIWVVDSRAAAGHLVGDLEKAGLNVVCPNATEIAHAFGLFYDGVRDDTLRHADDRIVTTGLAGAADRKVGDGKAWDRQNTTVDICGLVAETLAHWGWITRGRDDDYDAGDSVHFDLDEIVRLTEVGAYGPEDIARLWSAKLIDDKGLTELAARGVRIPAGLT